MKIERRRFLSLTGATAAGLLADAVVNAGYLLSANESEHPAPRFLLAWAKGAAVLASLISRSGSPSRPRT